MGRANGRARTRSTPSRAGYCVVPGWLFYQRLDIAKRSGAACNRVASSLRARRARRSFAHERQRAKSHRPGLQRQQLPPYRHRRLYGLRRRRPSGQSSRFIIPKRHCAIFRRDAASCACGSRCRAKCKHRLTRDSSAGCAGCHCPTSQAPRCLHGARCPPLLPFPLRRFLFDEAHCRIGT